MRILPFAPPRLWPDWQPPDSVLRSHACALIAEVTEPDIRDWLGREIRVWQPGFLPRHVCVRFAGRRPDRGRVHALVPRPGSTGRVHMGPTWRHLSEHRQELRPHIVRGSAIAWVAFAFSLPAAGEARLLTDPAQLSLPADVDQLRRAAIRARMEPPAVVSEGADGLLVRAVVARRHSLRDTLFHVRRDGEIQAGAGRVIEIGPSDEWPDFFGPNTGDAA